MKLTYLPLGRNAMTNLVKGKVAQSCPTLYDHMDCTPWNSPGQNTGVGSLSLLQGIFPTQGSTPGLLHCRQILYQLSHKGSPRILEWVVYLFSEDLPGPGIKPGSPALQADSLPTELSGKPYDPRQHIKKQRRHFANKGLYSQSYGLSSSHVRMWVGQ